MAPDSSSPRGSAGAARLSGALPALFAMLIALAAALAATSAHAAVFVCVIGGRTITGDQPPAECGGVTIRELNPDGTTKRTIDPPPTQAQVRQAEEDQHHRDAVAEAQREQLRHDRSLLETYASEDEIVTARDRALASRQTAVDRAEETLEEHRKERLKFDNEAEFYTKRELPPQLKRQLEQNEDSQHKEQKIIADIRTEMQRISERFEADRVRFHNLMQSGATPRRSTAEQPAGMNVSLAQPR
jgi:hypothetical protein